MTPPRSSSAPAVHDFHVRLQHDEWEAVRVVAGRVRMPVSAAVRLLVLRGLDREAMEPSTATASRRRQPADPGRDAYVVSLAALLAAEHSLLVLKDMAPSGAERAARLEDQAGAAAQRRLGRLNAAMRPEDAA
ncbi:MAG TPA: hypothetical protein VIN56_04800 [Candidatus Dormibacteraeota bacterium]